MRFEITGRLNDGGASAHQVEFPPNVHLDVAISELLDALLESEEFDNLQQVGGTVSIRRIT